MGSYPPCPPASRVKKRCSHVVSLWAGAHWPDPRICQCDTFLLNGGFRRNGLDPVAHKEMRGKDGSWHHSCTPLGSQACDFARLLSDGLRGRVWPGERGRGRHFLVPSNLWFCSHISQTLVLQSGQSLCPPPAVPFGLCWGTARLRKQEAMVEEGGDGGEEGRREVGALLDCWGRGHRSPLSWKWGSRMLGLAHWEPCLHFHHYCSPGWSRPSLDTAPFCLSLCCNLSTA